MALKSALSLLTRKIAQAMREAVAGQNMDRGRTRLYGTLEDESDHISLTLKTTQDCNELKLYSDFFQRIRALFPDSPSVAMHIGLVIRKNLEESELESYAVWVESGEDISDSLQRAYA